MYCFKCGREIDDNRPTSKDICPDCRAYLHCCFNCRFYDVKAPNQCRERVAVPVKEKYMANVCLYFEPTKVKPDLREKKRMDDARKRLDDLFRK